jgi:hypothetical protein
MKPIEEQNTDYAWDFLLEHGIATEEELQLVTKINGFNWVELMAVLYVRTGYHDLEQYLEMEGGAEWRDATKKDLAKECTLQDDKIKRLMEYIELIE